MSKKTKKNIAKNNKKKKKVNVAVNQEESSVKKESIVASQKDEPVKTDAKAKKQTPTKKAERNRKPGFFGRAINFLKDVKNELKKVTWPTSDELMKKTGIVAGIVTISTFFTWIVDSGFGTLAAMIIGAK